jgi:hypothetical protein
MLALSGPTCVIQGDENYVNTWKIKGKWKWQRMKRSHC